MDIPIETERLLLRRYRNSDVPDVVRYSSHPSISRVVDWTTDDGSVTEQSVTSFLDEQSRVEPGDSAWMDLAIAPKPDDGVIGTIGIICREHRQAEFGWALAAEHRGFGLATEAAAAMLDYGFQGLDRHRVYAVTTLWNERSWKLMERLGMRREGHFRESESARDEWQDVLTYGVLRAEWVEKA